MFLNILSGTIFETKSQALLDVVLRKNGDSNVLDALGCRSCPFVFKCSK